MKTIALKEVCDFFGDGDWIESKDQSDSGIRLIQTGNIGIGRFKDRIEKARWISEETFRNLRCTEIIEGDVLVSRLPDPVGRACLIPSLSHKAITAVDCAIIRFDGSRLIPKFFIYYSQSNEYHSIIQPLISGSTRERISREKLGNLLIPYPSILEQKVIIEKLDKAFAEIDSLEKNFQLKEEKTNQLLQSMLSAAFNYSKDSDMNFVKIGEVCNLMTGGTPSRSKSEFFTNGTIKWLVSGDINMREIFDCPGRITPEAMKSSNTKILPLNSVMIALNGQGKTRGTVAMLRTEATCNQSLVSIFPKDLKILIPEFIFYNLNMRYLEIRRMTGDDGNDRRGLNMSIIRDIEIPLPHVEIQNNIVNKIIKISSEIEKLKNQISIEKERISSLRQSILSNAFNFEEKAA